MSLERAAPFLPKLTRGILGSTFILESLVLGLSFGSDELKLVKTLEGLLDSFDVGDGSLHGVHYSGSRWILHWSY